MKKKTTSIKIPKILKNIYIDVCCGDNGPHIVLVTEETIELMKQLINEASKVYNKDSYELQFMKDLLNLMEEIKYGIAIIDENGCWKMPYIEYPDLAEILYKQIIIR